MQNGCRGIISAQVKNLRGFLNGKVVTDEKVSSYNLILVNADGLPLCGLESRMVS